MNTRQQRIYNFLGWVVTVPLVLLTLFLVGSMIPQLGYKIAMVQSGSMEPTIKTGGLVVYGKAAEYTLGDVVAFNHQTSDGNVITIHRVIEKNVDEVGGGQYVTRGDNNPDADPFQIADGDIQGRVWFSVPVGGYVVHWIQTVPGVGVVAAIPLVIIVYHEVTTFLQKRKKKNVTAASPSSKVVLDENV